MQQHLKINLVIQNSLTTMYLYKLQNKKEKSTVSHGNEITKLLNELSSEFLIKWFVYIQKNV